MWKRLLCLVSFLSLASLMPAAQAADETAAVTKAAEKLRVLMVDPERAGLEAIVAKELSYGHSGGKLDTQQSFVDDLLNGVSNFVSITISDQTVRVVGDVAIVRHTLFAETADKGKEAGTVKLGILQIWQKQHGHWKLLARQARAIANP